MRATHTVATLDVPAQVYDAIARDLLRADYHHVFENDGAARSFAGGNDLAAEHMGLMDMTGLGLVRGADTRAVEFRQMMVDSAYELVGQDIPLDQIELALASDRMLLAVVARQIMEITLGLVPGIPAPPPRERLTITYHENPPGDPGPIRPQKQRHRHDPENGSFGDCDRTALAVLMGIDREEVPHWYDNEPLPLGSDPEFLKRVGETKRAWLASRGLAIVKVPFTGTASFSDIMAMQASQVPGLCYILEGRSRNGVNHVVVCQGGDIVCDPAIDNSGIVGPADDGHWWIEYLVPSWCCRPPLPVVGDGVQQDQQHAAESGNGQQGDGPAGDLVTDATWDRAAAGLAADADAIAARRYRPAFNRHERVVSIDYGPDMRGARAGLPVYIDATLAGTVAAFEPGKPGQVDVTLNLSDIGLAAWRYVVEDGPVGFSIGMEAAKFTTKAASAGDDSAG